MVLKALILQGDLGITGQAGELSTADRPLHWHCFSQIPRDCYVINSLRFKGTGNGGAFL